MLYEIIQIKKDARNRRKGNSMKIYIKKRVFLFFLIMSGVFSLDAAALQRPQEIRSKKEVIRVVPYFIQPDGNAFVFLQKERVGAPFWKDFLIDYINYKTSYEQLKNETRGVISFEGHDFTSMPDYTFDGESTIGYIHFIDISDQVKSKNTFEFDKNRFALIPVSDLLRAPDTLRYAYEGVPVSRGVVKLLREDWNDYISILKPLDYEERVFNQNVGQLVLLIPSRQAFPLVMSPETMPDAIFFYELGKPYYEFTNFYPAEINIDRYAYPTTEHYFQAQKFIGYPKIMESIRTSKSPREAYTIAAQNSQFKRSDWNMVSIQVMFRALIAKFVQHPNLLDMLLKTGNRAIVENTALVKRGHDDPFWGNGLSGMGENYLGRLLMLLRDLFIRELPASYVRYQQQLSGIPASGSPVPRAPQTTASEAPKEKGLLSRIFGGWF